MPVVGGDLGDAGVSGSGGGSRPMVAVAASRLAPGRIVNWTDGAEAAGVSYLEGLRRAGTVPVVLGDPGGVDPGDLLAPFAGVVLMGGGDVDPSSYGQRPHPATYGVDAGRDRFEMGLARRAVADGIPLLAICRGMQVLNVALGGTLHQHLADVVGSAVAHGIPVGSGEPAVHPVDVEPGSRLEAVVARGGSLRRCTSIHHQSVADVAPGLCVTARSVDGTVEALETPADATGWVLAVQWHPERTAAADPAQQAVFAALAEQTMAAAGHCR